MTNHRHTPPPCTYTAKAYGCICASPHWVHPNCPLHDAEVWTPKLLKQVLAEREAAAEVFSVPIKRNSRKQVTH